MINPEDVPTHLRPIQRPPVDREELKMEQDRLREEGQPSAIEFAHVRQYGEAGVSIAPDSLMNQR